MRRIHRRAFLATGLGLGALSRWGRLLAANEPQAAAFRYENERHFEVVHQGSFRNGQIGLESLELWIPLPLEDERQAVHALTILPRVPTSRDIHGLATVARLYRTRGLPAPGETVTLGVAYQVTLQKVVPDWEAIHQAAAGPYPNDRQLRLFTRPETKIESKHPAIVEQAQRLQAEARTPLALARAAYDWVRQTIVYQRDEEAQGAVSCLKSGRGECGEFSLLFVALCRAAGVPARPVSGFWADETNGWHCWAEVLLPNGEWLPVDPTLGQGGPAAARFHFGSLDNRRVAVCRANDVEAGNAHGSHRQWDSLQKGACWWQGKNLNEPPERPEIRFQVAGEEVEASG